PGTVSDREQYRSDPRCSSGAPERIENRLRRESRPSRRLHRRLADPSPGFGTTASQAFSYSIPLIVRLAGIIANPQRPTMLRLPAVGFPTNLLPRTKRTDLATNQGMHQ